MRASPASRRMEPLSHYNNEILIALKKKKKKKNIGSRLLFNKVEKKNTHILI